MNDQEIQEASTYAIKELECWAKANKLSSERYNCLLDIVKNFMNDYTRSIAKGFVSMTYQDFLDQQKQFKEDLEKGVYG